MCASGCYGFCGAIRLKRDDQRRESLPNHFFRLYPKLCALAVSESPNTGFKPIAKLLIKRVNETVSAIFIGDSGSIGRPARYSVIMDDEIVDSLTRYL